MNNQNSTHLFEEKFLSSINYINESKIYNEFQNNKKIIIFDLRKKEDFEKYHLDCSINLPYDILDLGFFQSIDENKLSGYATSDEMKANLKKYKRFYIAIILSQTKVKRKIINELNTMEENDEKDLIMKGLTLYKTLVKNRIRELGFFNIGFENFLAHYYFLVIVNGKSIVGY